MCNNTSNSQEYTFPKLLEQYGKILVPMIQRDYAQGRTDKKATDVRNNLLNDIFSGKDVHFDLVFGSKEKRIINGEEKNCFIPVDGQQRLTTLFMLYLYGQKKGNTDQRLDLSKFSYDTRRAASDFCNSITSKEWIVPNDKKVSDVIKDSSWFMNYWENDPTVAGMLTMLDAIHERCKEENCYPNLEKVKFYFFDLDSNGLNENLYLKMNSRGKPLSAFENLKAKIEKVLPDTIEIEKKFFPDDANTSPEDFKGKWKYFIDRAWTKDFWDKENPEKYDESITKFIVRFLSGYWAAFGKDEEQTIAKSLKDINSNNDNDNYRDFIPFEPIKKVLKLENAFQTLAYALTTVPSISPYWIDGKIEVSDKSEYKFLAVVFTFVLFDGDKDAMRFAWNMAENYVAGYDTFIAYCKRAKEIRDNFDTDKKNAFYKALLNNNFTTPSEQLKEEISKAQQILNGSPRQDGKNWEEIIIEAEKYEFFKGAIRFLFTKENIGDDWAQFEQKWENAKKYFDKDGVKDGKDKYKTNALLMKSLLANCDNFWKKIWWWFEFSNDAIRWKRILLSNNWRNAVDAIMSNEVTTETTKECVKKIKDPWIRNIVDDGLMDYVCNKMPGARIRSTYHDYHAIWQSGYPSYQITLNPILSQLKYIKSIDYSEKNKIRNCRYYKCEDRNVDFKCKNKDKDYFFRWYGDTSETVLDIYLMKENWEEALERKNKTTCKGTEEDGRFCFRVTKDMKPEEFENELKKLIEDYDNDQR